MRRFGWVLVGLLVSLGVVWGNYWTIPRRNTEQRRLDALLVLGSPTDPEGEPSPEERTRVAAAAQEFRAGVAPVVIVSGGAAHNRYVEADAMARLAVGDGVPAEAVIEETQARNTIENIWFSNEILRSHGWRSVEVVSSPSHLPRASLILELYPELHWETHAAQWPPEFLRGRIRTIYWQEALECLRLRVFGFPRNAFLPPH